MAGRKFMVTCLGLASFFPFSAGSASRPETWDEAKSHAIGLMQLGDCAGVWDTIWPWLKAGNPDARFAAASAIAFGGLVPPGESRDLLSIWRHITILVVYSDNINRDEWSDSYDILFKSVVSPLLGSIDPYGFQKYKECYSNDSGKDCWKIAESYGMVPKFDDYIVSLEAIANSKSDNEAECPEK